MKILAVGDSWASAVEGDTGLDRGWPEILELPEDCRQGISGSTAYEWAQNKDERLTKALESKADVIVLSLMGNDFRHAYDDGKVTSEEVSLALTSMSSVVRMLSRRSRVFTLLYADPFDGKNKIYKYGLPMLNAGIRAASFMRADCIDLGSILSPEHFDGKDIHPTRAGHEVIAQYLGNYLMGGEVS